MRILLVLAVVLALGGAVAGLTALASETEGPQGLQGIQGIKGIQGVAGLMGEQGPAGDQTCQTCHNETTMLLSKSLQWGQSGHGTGTSYGRGTSASCAGCHASEGFTVRVETGVAFDSLEEGISGPTPQNCRTCHDIHTDYTEDDWGLSTEGAVTLLVAGQVFDGGEGNLCASCHQPRRGILEDYAAVDGMVSITSTHWGPHHGVEANTLLGIGGWGEAGEPAPGHYAMEDDIVAEDTCVTCHLGPNDNHTFAPDEDNCQVACHEDVEDFDFNYENVQEDVQALFDELGELLEAIGIMHDGHPVVGDYTEAQAGALWNYLWILEDGSLGVHNSEYMKGLLEVGIAALQ